MKHLKSVLTLLIVGALSACSGADDAGDGTRDVDGDSIADARDNCLNVTNESQVDANQNGVGRACEEKPVVEPLSTQVAIGNAITIPLMGSDEEGDILTYSVNGVPLDPGVRTFTYVAPSDAQRYTSIELVYSAFDGESNSDQSTINIEYVPGVNEPATGFAYVDGKPIQNSEGVPQQDPDPYFQGKTLIVEHQLKDIDSRDESVTVNRYIWKANGVEIYSGLSDQFTLTQNEVGKTVSVDVVYQDQHFSEELVFSSTFSQEIQNVNDPLVGSVLLSGTRIVGQTLAASNNFTDLDGVGDVTYEWFKVTSDDYEENESLDNDLGTGNSYSIQTKDALEDVYVKASYVDGEGTTEVARSSTIKILRENDNPVTFVSEIKLRGQGLLLDEGTNQLYLNSCEAADLSVSLINANDDEMIENETVNSTDYAEALDTVVWEFNDGDGWEVPADVSYMSTDVEGLLAKIITGPESITADPIRVRVRTNVGVDESVQTRTYLTVANNILCQSGGVDIISDNDQGDESPRDLEWKEPYFGSDGSFLFEYSDLGREGRALHLYKPENESKDKYGIKYHNTTQAENPVTRFFNEIRDSGDFNRTIQLGMWVKTEDAIKIKWTLRNRLKKGKGWKTHYLIDYFIPVNNNNEWNYICQHVILRNNMIDNSGQEFTDYALFVRVERNDAPNISVFIDDMSLTLVDDPSAITECEPDGGV